MDGSLQGVFLRVFSPSAVISIWVERGWGGAEGEKRRKISLALSDANMLFLWVDPFHVQKVGSSG